MKSKRPSDQEKTRSKRRKAIDEVWNLGTMFSQLARRSTGMLVNGVFKQPKTVVVAPDVLSKFSKLGNVSSSDEVFDVSIS